jgi:4'-phosphopantetheinyl transferase EntD
VIEEILPGAVATAEGRGEDGDASLLAGEGAIVARAVEKRRREFAAGRDCARRALGRLGVPPAPILSGERGEPLWPEGVVGSITHCDGYWAAAVARAVDVLTLGVDAEPNAPLPDGVLGDVARAEELPRVAGLAAADPSVRWDRLLFSAKESVYKAWFPLARRWLGFEDAELSIDSAVGAFTARLLVEGPTVAGRPLTGFEGRWLVRDGLIVTAITVPAPPQ